MRIQHPASCGRSHDRGRPSWSEIGQRIELAENADDGASLACFRDEGCCHAAHIARDAEALALQDGDLLGNRAVFLEGEFRHGPDSIAQGAVIARFGVHVAGNSIEAQAVVVHGWSNPVIVGTGAP
jgi:hypothetical protein